MRIVRWFASILQSPTGETSSKRILAFGFFFAALYAGLVNKDFNVTTVYSSAATILLGVAAVTKS